MKITLDLTQLSRPTIKVLAELVNDLAADLLDPELGLVEDKANEYTTLLDFSSKLDLFAKGYLE